MQKIYKRLSTDNKKQYTIIKTFTSIISFPQKYLICASSTNIIHLNTIQNNIFNRFKNSLVQNKA